jgi:hypothetical protein
LKGQAVTDHGSTWVLLPRACFEPRSGWRCKNCPSPDAGSSRAVSGRHDGLLNFVAWTSVVRCGDDSTLVRWSLRWRPAVPGWRRAVGDEETASDANACVVTDVTSLE